MPKPLILALVLLPCLTLQAFSASSTPSFTIEKIIVNGNQHASAEVVRTESRIEEGRSYTELELTRAMYRINRLPFILEAEFALEKGSRRGSYHLVITVRETRLYFADFNSFNVTNDEGDHHSLEYASIGRRFFTGSHGLFYVALRPVYSISQSHTLGARYTAGYAHHNLFDRRVYANLEFTHLRQPDQITVTENSRHEFLFEDNLSATLQLSVPIFANQWLKGAFHHLEYTNVSITDNFNVPDARFESERRSQTDAQYVFWEYNTTDDIFLPSTGTVYQAGYRHEAFSTESSPPGIPAGNDAEYHRIFVGWDRYWRFGGRHTFLVNSELQYYESRFSLTQITDITGNIIPRIESKDYSTGSGLALGYAFDAWGWKKKRRFGDLRFEVKVSNQFNRLGPTPSLNNPFELNSNLADLDLDVLALDFAVKLRNSWGVFQAVLQYSTND